MPLNDAAQLDQRLLQAHARGDKAVMVALYTRAGDVAEQQGRTDAACFYLTHAYIFALETDHPEAGALHARLCAHGREQ